MTHETHNKMDSLRFVQIVQSYGSDPKCWPHDERAAAIDFAKREPAQDILRAEHHFDALLASNAAPAPSEILRARILARAKDAPPIANDRGPMIKRFGALAAMLVIAAAVTWSTGLLSPETRTEEPLYETPLEFVQADIDALWDEAFF